jgi:hypothetical protein
LEQRFDCQQLATSKKQKPTLMRLKKQRTKPRNVNSAGNTAPSKFMIALLACSSHDANDKSNTKTKTEKSKKGEASPRKAPLSLQETPHHRDC